ncbi:c-type cytochrome [Arhodomonas sp. SL1]|uniref:c-type cytochrome n=1 Tax=Arhodomonas sp. SL1 TaxID=3425691 RepID=UPI003F88109C
MSRGPFAALALATVGVVAPALAADGQAVFEAHCAACHQADGSGAPGFIPPLSGSLGHFLAAPGGREYLINVVTNGLVGRIQVGGQAYASNMPAFGGQLDSAEIAAVLDYVLTRFNPTSLPSGYDGITPGQAATLADEGLNANDMNARRAGLVLRLAEEGVER